MADYVGQIGHSFHNQLLSDLEGNWACLLAENKQVHHIVFPGGLLHQMPVAQGEGIGIHHHSGNPIPLPAGFGQPGAVVGKATAAVFHEDQLFRNPGNFIKAQIRQELGRGDFGIEKQPEIPPGGLIVRQMTDNPVQQALTLVPGGHRQTPQGVFKAAASGNQFTLVVKDAAGVVQVAVQPDALLMEQRFHLFVVPAPRGDGLYGFIHGLSSFCQFRQIPARRKSADQTGR